MRTTLTLDEDVAVALKQLSLEEHKTWKQVVNDVLRRGLASGGKPRERYRTIPHDAGTLLMPADLVSTGDMLDWAEGEDRR